MASSTNPADWGTYEQAAAVSPQVGFVFTERDPFWFVDIDSAWDGKAWSLVAQEICARLSGAAVEVSQSGTGLHLIGSGTPPADHANKNTALKLELYTRERFVALTGTNATGDAATDLTSQLASVAAQFFTRAAGTTSAEWTTEPCAEWVGPADDADLLERALRSGQASAAAAFGGAPTKATFADLFTANADVLGAIWPHETGPYDASSADQSFANMLAFWTGRDCERMERLMRMSGLARAKWDNHNSYLQGTILKACGLVRDVYKGGHQTTTAVDPGPPPTQAAMDEAGVTARLDGGLMLYQGQLEHFKGCVYVRALNKILTPGGDLLDQGRFNVEFGGYEFILDTVGKKTTPSAWTAYTENQSYRPAMADRICFRPERAEAIVVDSGKALANTYRPVPHDDLVGDPEPFLSHLRRMLPHGEDFEMLLSWMASVVQNPGMKAQWWPVVQGAEGNFKSFLLSIMAHAVGSHYAHNPNMEKMIRGGSNFNGWIDRKLFLGLDEVYAANRRDFFEGFKTTVTNRSIPIEGKGVEEVTGDNRANGMIVTNHQDGVPISGRNRRFAAFFCAQQTPADMLRDGMGPAYISNLKDWLLGEGAHVALGTNYGIRVMASHLRHRTIEARMDPARLSIRCPETTSTAAALNAGRGRIEQEVQEVIDEGRVGFAGGWVSSTYLGRLLEHLRTPLAPNKRRELMQTLGYDYHPALEPSGRLGAIVKPDDGRPRLYIKAGHLALNVTSPAEVARLYTAAQDKATAEATKAQLTS